jgi:UDP:flavonoid glycosyltransferase YjiC (YdhE family)
MKIVIIATGSRGDVEPYVALGKGLQQAGHTVRLVTHEDFESLAKAHGLEFWPVEGSVVAIAQSQEMRKRIGGGNFMSVLKQMAKEAESASLSLAKTGLTACRDADLVIAGIAGLFSGVTLAEKFQIPLLQAYYIPFTPTRGFPCFMIPGMPTYLGGAINRFSYQVARQMIWQGFRPADRIARKQALDLPPSPFWGPFDSPIILKSPVLYAFSPVVIPPPADWEGHARVTGYWFSDLPAGWTPPPELVTFLESGPPPVYVGFGSMSQENPEATTRLVVEALAQTGQRGILSAGWGALARQDMPESIFLADPMPFSWLFPRMSAVVHHGGAGTTAHGLRAGVPSIVIPFFADQPFWGRRVSDLGAGPLPIPLKKLTAAKLAGAIRQAVSDEKMRQRAAGLGVVIQAEDGVANAVSAIEQIRF